MLDQWEVFTAGPTKPKEDRLYLSLTFKGQIFMNRQAVEAIGSPETVARKIAATSRVLGLSRFTLKIGSGPMPDALQRHSIELFGAEVIPRVRELLADGASQPPGTMAP